MGPIARYSHPDPAAGALTGPPPEFGHAMHRYFGFDPHYTNLNHGSYGSLPIPVRAACDDLTSQIESNPDLFIRRRYQPLIVEVREALADLIGAETDECVMVPNTTQGLNIVLQNFAWNEADVIVGSASFVHLNHAYQYLLRAPAASRTCGSVSRAIQFTAPRPSISLFDLRSPTSPHEIVSRFKGHIRSIPRASPPTSEPQKIVAVIDSIVSLPGILMPWKEMVQICREEGVWSVVNASHSIGQEVGINLNEVQPDFWVSNCHKWLFAKRSCAVLYVPKRNQHIIKTMLPTSYAHVSPSGQQVSDSESFLARFQWNATTDFIPFLSVLAALDFRDWLGGEAKINAYCHSLAIKGGRRLAWVLGTRVMDESGEMTANMVTVEMPLPRNIPWSAEVDEMFREKLLEEWNVYAAHFYYDGKWWVRCSAQVWNEMRDFLVLGLALISVCNEVRERFEGTGGNAASRLTTKL